MQIIPVKTEYIFHARSHVLRGEVAHRLDSRHLSYFFDDELVHESDVESGGFIADDDSIRAVAEEYFRTHTNVMSDLFNNHTEQVSLYEKKSSFLFDNNGGFTCRATVSEQRGLISLSMASVDGKDQLSTQLQVTNMSEALEKLRIFLNTLDGLSSTMAANISELVNDKVMTDIQWETR